MRRLVVAAAAAMTLGGCIAVPAPYTEGYYYPAPAIGVGIYSAPIVVHGHRHHHRHRGYSGHWR
jgi:hypothetical protein